VHWGVTEGRRLRPHRLFAAGAVVLALASVVAVSAASAHPVHTYSTPVTAPLRTGLFDPYSFVGASSAFGMAKAAGASYLRLPFNWNSVAPETPLSGSDAKNPDSYAWGGLDQTVSAIEAAGLTPILDIGSPPKWAYAVRPRGKNAGTPKVAALGQFARALATHYDGGNGAPVVRVYQVWNEPNNSLDLSPVKPATYRSMINAVASSVHAVSRANVVVAGALDPFSNKTRNWHSEAPLTYMRAMLCLSGGAHPHRTCKNQVHFDVWSHHPYTFGGPFAHARLPDDVSLGDLPKMRALLNAGKRLHRLVTVHPLQFWVTEFAWGTSPPRKGAAPLALAARWTSESLYQMWRSGVSLVTWFQLEDQSKPSPYVGGLYFHASTLAKARPKTVRTAFRFPFVAYLGKGRVSVWGRDATSTKTLVTIQRRVGLRGHWRTVARVMPNRYGIFRAALRMAATKKSWFRARATGSGNSLPFSLTVPKPKSKYGPWGHAG
jgi:hypothetical protein